MKGMNKQKGFTIIELVVVILLLGILTATALPRFMDVTDDAHAAVVDAVQGGLGTSVALYRAQWFADNQPNTVTGGDFNLKSYQGYPTGNTGAAGTAVANSMTTSDMCVDLFEGLLQDTGRPTIAAKTADTIALATIYSTLGDDADFIAYLRNTDGNHRTCNYAYTGQFTSTSFGDVPVIIYDVANGTVTRGAVL